jgi:hypothetical protein
MPVGAARRRGAQLTGPGGLLARLTRQMLQTALHVELADHLQYERSDLVGTAAVTRGADRRARARRTNPEAQPLRPAGVAAGRLLGARMGANCVSYLATRGST